MPSCHEPQRAAREPEKFSPGDHNASSDDRDENSLRNDDDPDADALLADGKGKADTKSTASRVPPVSLTCAVLPPGSGLHDFSMKIV